MAEPIITKTCPQCQIEKKTSEFHKNKCKPDGLQNTCKDCSKKYQLANKEAIKEYKRRRYLADRDAILLDRKRYVKINKETIKERKHRHYIENRESILMKCKEYRDENKDKIAKRDRKYYQANKEKILKKSKQYRIEKKDKLLAQKKKYFRSPEGKAAKRRNSHKRRIQKKSTSYEYFDYIEVFDRDGYICQLCGRKTRPDFKNPNHQLYPNLDHIIPLSLGGSHTKKNTQCLCHQCNIEKGSLGVGDQLRMFG